MENKPASLLIRSLEKAFSGIHPSMCDRHLAGNGSGGRVVRASASLAVDSSLIPSEVKPTTLKLIFTASLLDAQH